MNNLKILRKKQNLTQQQVADAIGIGMQAYAYYEKEERDPSPDTLCKLADFFNVSLDELLGRTSEPGIFDDARLPKTRVQELFDQLSIIDQGRILGKMELMIEEYSKDQTSTPTYQEQKNTWGTL